jgi:hypothetical protein
MLSVIMLNVIMLNVIMLNVIMLSEVMLSVMMPQNSALHFQHELCTIRFVIVLLIIQNLCVLLHEKCMFISVYF